MSALAMLLASRARLRLRMSSHSLHACNAPACPHVTHERYCEKHKHLLSTERVSHDRERGTAAQRGYNARWRRYASAFLAKHPICCDPYKRHEGETRASFQVDHITPHKGDTRLFWDKSNHQALCASCGGYKSAVESGGRAQSKKVALPPVSGVMGLEWSAAVSPALSNERDVVRETVLDDPRPLRIV